MVFTFVCVCVGLGMLTWSAYAPVQVCGCVCMPKQQSWGQRITCSVDLAFVTFERGSLVVSHYARLPGTAHTLLTILLPPPPVLSLWLWDCRSMLLNLTGCCRSKLSSPCACRKHFTYWDSSKPRCLIF